MHFFFQPKEANMWDIIFEKRYTSNHKPSIHVYQMVLSHVKGVSYLALVLIIEQR